MAELTRRDLKEVFIESLEPFAKSTQKDFHRIDERFDSIDKRLNKIEATMVTKDYLDDKLADLRGDLVVLMRKEDKKLQTLVDVLLKRKVISEKEKNHILSMEPFPQLLASK